MRQGLVIILVQTGLLDSLHFSFVFPLSSSSTKCLALTHCCAATVIDFIFSLFQRLERDSVIQTLNSIQCISLVFHLQCFLVEKSKG